DDHDGGAAGRAPARPREGRGLGAAAAPRHRDRGRAHREPAPHALHHAGHLPRLPSAGAALPARSGGAGMNITAPVTPRPAARDVQAAINAARGYLPPALPNNPSYRKVNPADAPIMIVALTSDTLGRGQMYDAASSILQQKLSQLPGVGQVIVGGSSLPGVR